MYSATIAMGDLLKRSVANKKVGNWRTLGSNFRPPGSPGITPGCINIAPCWFQQGHEVGHTPRPIRFIHMSSATVYLPRIRTMGSNQRSRQPSRETEVCP